jgi:hypothetical protein
MLALGTGGRPGLGYLTQNLGEEFEQFRPGPSREELNHMLNLSQ